MGHWLMLRLPGQHRPEPGRQRPGVRKWDWVRLVIRIHNSSGGPEGPEIGFVPSSEEPLGASGGMGGIGFVRRSCPSASDWLEVADLRETSSCRRRRNWVRLVKRVGVRKGRIGFVSPNKGPASGRVADLDLAAMRPKAWLFPIQRPRVGVLVGRSGCIKDSLGPQGSRVRDGSYWPQSSRRLAQGIQGK